MSDIDDLLVAQNKFKERFTEAELKELFKQKNFKRSFDQAEVPEDYEKLKIAAEYYLFVYYFKNGKLPT